MSGITTQQMLLSIPSIPVNITFTASAINTSASDTYTFTSQSLGTAASDRIIVIGVYGRDTGTSTSISSVSVAGNAATPIVQASHTGDGNSNIAGLYAVAVPSGTTGDVVVVYNQAIIRGGIGVWRMVGKASVTASDTASVSTGSPDPVTVSLDIPAQGAAIAISGDGSGNSNTSTWTGLTEDFDTLITTNSYTGAHDNFTTIQSGLTIGPNRSGAVVSPVIVAASWGN